jgi:hypothetical protein
MGTRRANKNLFFYFSFLKGKIYVLLHNSPDVAKGGTKSRQEQEI